MLYSFLVMMLEMMFLNNVHVCWRMMLFHILENKVISWKMFAGEYEDTPFVEEC